MQRDCEFFPAVRRLAAVAVALVGAIAAGCADDPAASGDDDGARDIRLDDRAVAWPDDSDEKRSGVSLGDGRFDAPGVGAGRPVVGWTRTLGGQAQEWPAKIVAGPDGSVVVTGTFSGTVDFDPGPLELLRSAGDRRDRFVLALGPEGDVRWVRVLRTGPTRDPGLDLALAPDGAPVLAGRFSGSIDLDPSPEGVVEQNSAGGDDLFVVHFDANGDYRWSRTMGGAGDDRGVGLATAADGAVLVTGRVSGLVDFDPDPDSELVRGREAVTSFFVASLGPEAGDLQWVSTFENDGADADVAAGSSVVAGPDGAFVVGRFEGALDFDPEPLEADERVSAGGHDAFVAAFDPQGVLRWATTFGDELEDAALAAAVFADGTVLVTGYYERGLSLDGGRTVEHWSRGEWDTFVLALDALGEPLWSTSLGGRGWDWGAGVAIAGDDVVVTGAFQHRVVFVPGDGEQVSNGSWDYYLAKLDAAGEPRWARTWGELGRDYADDVAVSPDGSIVVLGSFEEAIDFDPCLGDDVHASNGGSDTFVTRLTAGGCYL